MDRSDRIRYLAAILGLVTVQDFVPVRLVKAPSQVPDSRRRELDRSRTRVQRNQRRG